MGREPPEDFLAAWERFACDKGEWLFYFLKKKENKQNGIFHISS